MHTEIFGKRGRKRPFRRLKHRWEGNIGMGLEEIQWEGWLGLVWLRPCGLVGAQVP